MTDPRHLGALELVRAVCQREPDDDLAAARRLWRAFIADPTTAEVLIDFLAASCRNELVAALVLAGGSTADVAEALDLEPDNVRQIVRRARRRLHDRNVTPVSPG